MYKKLLAVAIGLCAMMTPTALAADHGDGPQVTAAPEADITDVFTWMPDATHVALVMDVTPNAGPASANPQFSNVVKYVFHITSFTSYNPVAPGPVDQDQIACTFDNATPQNVSCWLQVNGTTTDYVTGNATGVAGLQSMNGSFQVFTGLRADPFYFNLDGFHFTIANVVADVPLLVDAGAFTAAGCPQLPPDVAGALAMQLGQGWDGGVAMDNFAGFNVQTITLQVNASALTAGSVNNVLGVWASTNN